MKNLLILFILFLSCLTGLYGKSPCLIQSKVTFNRNSGYVNINELNYGIGLFGKDPPYGKGFLGLTSMHGYQLNISGHYKNSNIIGGIGVGISFYEGGSLMPLYLDLRYTRNVNNFSVFIFEDNGLLLNPKNPGRGGMFFIDPGAGIKYKISKVLSASLGAGLFIQMGPNIRRDSFVNLKAGIVFKPK